MLTCHLSDVLCVYRKLGNFSENIIGVSFVQAKVSKFRCSGACSIQTHMEQGLSLCPDFVVQGTHENKLTMKISQITVVTKLAAS